MLISKKNGVINTDNFEKVYTCSKFIVYMNGILFCRGKKAGRESINYIAEKIKSDRTIPFHELFGSYTVLIDICNKRQILFSDNSCMHGLFISDNYIGSNFKELVKTEGLYHFDKIGVCEYLGLIRGGLSGKTYVKGINISSNLNFYEIDNGNYFVRSKKIDDIDGESSIDDPIEFFRDISYALEDMKCVCALTGGFDSRAVAAVMNTFRSYDCFISGDNNKSPEIKSAVRTAKAGNFVMMQIKPEYSDIKQSDMNIKFLRTASFHTAFDTAQMRIDYFMNILKKQGYEILVDGSAGDMHKEFWFTQEFPYYWRRKSNPKRFYKMRMKQYSRFLGKMILDNINEMEEMELSVLNRLTKDRNSKSCLFYGWYNDWFSMAAKNSESESPAVYSPLQEIELVRYSYQMLPKGKFMNGFLRELTSCANRKAARVKTVYGTTASNEPIYLARDFVFQILRYGQQGMRFFVRKVFHKSIFLVNVDLKNLDNKVLETEIAEEAVKWAKSKGCISQEASCSNIPFVLFEKIMNLYLTDAMFFQKNRE